MPSDCQECRASSEGRQDPVVSIITVVYNEASKIGPTAESVWAQDYPHLEYIVIDGGSSDGTVNFLRSNDARISLWTSEPDAGIYDAMNKGAANATGDWIMFMNAGDRLSSPSVLSKIFAERKWRGDEFIYGDHCVVYPDGSRRYVKALDIAKAWRGMVMSHQSLFSPRGGPVDLVFEHVWGTAADYAFIARAIAAGSKFCRLQGLCVADYAAGGVSDIQRLKSLALTRRASQQYGLAPNYKTLPWFGFWMGIEVFKLGLKKFLVR